MRRPIFLDRDGVINRDLHDYVTRVEDFELFPWTVSSLRNLYQAGFDLFVLSNQQGVGKGRYSASDLQAMDDKLRLACSGFEIKHIAYSTALESENHPDRKPAPGMIFQAQRQFGFELSQAAYIGDKPTDMEFAVNGGLIPLLVYSGLTAPGQEINWPIKPYASFESLQQAAEWVIERAKPAGLRFSVTGRVQGVGFRAYVKSLAKRFGLAGEVWNTRTGAVEGQAFGPADYLSQFGQDLLHGPGYVQNAISEPAPFAGADTFAIGATR